MRHRSPAGKLSFLASKVARRRVAVAGIAALGASVATVGAALPAGAAATPTGTSQNSIIVGQGSATTYYVMQALDTIFNQASVEGCPLFESQVGQGSQLQQLDYSCATFGGSSPGTFGPLGGASAPNPFNDAAVEEPQIGSSNGIAAIEDSGGSFGTTGVNVYTGINFARSSRDPAGTDDSGLNFVAYAKDGVPWFHFTDVGGVPTPSSRVVSLTQAQMQGIFLGYSGTAAPIAFWNQVQVGTIRCVETSAGPPPTFNYENCTAAGQVVPLYAVPNTNPSPIIVVAAQEGSGTQATFKTFLGKDPSTGNKVNCDPGLGVSGTPPVPTTCYGPMIILENELTQVTTGVAPAGLWTQGQANYITPPSGSSLPWSTTQGGSGSMSQANLYSDMIFFYSFGKWTEQCKNKDCGAVRPVLPANDKEALGDVGGVANPGSAPYTGTHVATWAKGIAPTEGTILGSSSCTPPACTGDGLFPIDRYLYNVYSNGSNTSGPGTGIPEATAPTLNYMSEVGAICRASNEFNLDPNTGHTYLSEIQAAILVNGFYPLSAGAATGTVNASPIDEGDVAGGFDAFALLSAYATAHPSQQDVDFITPGTDQEYSTAAWGTGQTNGTFTNSSTLDPMGYCLVKTTGT